MKCPICSKAKLKKVKKERKASIVSGDKFSYFENWGICSNCKFEGPLTSNSKNYEKMRKLTTKQAVKRIVGLIHHRFSNLLYVERALGLPRRTMSKWKSLGENSTSSLLLLKLIETFPFLVSVVENKFDRGFANKALKDAAKFLEIPDSLITNLDTVKSPESEDGKFHYNDISQLEGVSSFHVTRQTS